MLSQQIFYDSYHQKNNKFYKVIKKNNFTYYEIIRFFYSKILPKLTKFPKIKILDVGCGVGTMALYFGSLGIKVKGIDISSRAIKIANNAREYLKFKNVSFSESVLKKGKGEFDMVMISEVIEHIEDEQKFLENIHSQLKNNGLLYLTTPLKENLLYEIGFYKKFDQEVGHLRRYTETSIKKLLENNKFEVLNTRQVEGPLRNLLFVTRLGFLIKFIRGPLVPIFHRLDWITMKLFGASNILVLARKKK